jgi:hypothetical protein
MSDETKKPTSHIRTYANDMKVERKKRGLTESEEETLQTSKQKKNTKDKASEVKKPAEPIEQKPAAGKDIVPHVPTKIPAFHELKKQPVPKETYSEESKKIVANREADKKDIVTKKETIVHTDIGSDATVITDTQHNRFKLLPSILASITSWVKKITTSNKKKAPMYTIPEASRRKGVIQKATSKTGTIFTADSGTLKEQIRLRRIEEANKEKLAKQLAEDEPETSWSPYTDTGYNLLEAPEVEVPIHTIQNVTVEFKKKAVPVETAQPVAIVEKEEETPVNILIAKEATGVPTVEKAPVVSVIPTKPEMDEEPEEIIEVKDEVSEKVVLEKSTMTFKRRLDTNTLTVIILSAVIGLVIVIFTARVFVQYISDTFTPDTSSSSPATTILKTTSLDYITLTQENINRLPSLLVERIPDSQSQITEFVIVSQNGSLISPSNVFNTLGFNVVSSLHRALTHVRFLSTPTSNEIILITFIDETTVQGGLLFWEQGLVSDLNKIFTLPEGLTGSFSDRTISDVDVRVLEKDGKTVLLYGIINENTALITTSAEEFSSIIASEFTD